MSLYDWTCLSEALTCTAVVVQQLKVPSHPCKPSCKTVHNRSVLEFTWEKTIFFHLSLGLTLKCNSLSPCPLSVQNVVFPLNFLSSSGLTQVSCPNQFNNKLNKTFNLSAQKAAVLLLFCIIYNLKCPSGILGRSIYSDSQGCLPWKHAVRRLHTPCEDAKKNWIRLVEGCSYPL